MEPFVRMCHDDNIKTTILVIVENSNTAQKIQEGLISVSGCEQSCLNIHVCETVDQVLRSEQSIVPDYVAFVIDSSEYLVLKSIENGIKKLSKEFLLDRICLIIDTSQGGNKLLTSDIVSFRQKFQLHTLWGNVQDENYHLCERIFNLVTALCGTFTGFPVITVQDRYTSSIPKNQLL